MPSRIALRLAYFKIFLHNSWRNLVLTLTTSVGKTFVYELIQNHSYPVSLQRTNINHYIRFLKLVPESYLYKYWDVCEPKNHSKRQDPNYKLIKASLFPSSVLDFQGTQGRRVERYAHQNQVDGLSCYLQSVTGYLRLTLGLMWNCAQRKELIYVFQKFLAGIVKMFILAGRLSNKLSFYEL